MDKFIIHGPCKLSGEVSISSSKNACLPILMATILSEKEIVFKNIPKLRDIDTTFELLQRLGVVVEKREDNRVAICAKTVHSLEAKYDLVKTMRASILVLGPLLARFGKGVVSLPGGCAIGTRPIDIHLDGLKEMGAIIELQSGYVTASAPEGLKGAVIEFPMPSVGATENIMMAATLAKGTTVIKNAAKEPEIVDLERFLNAIGAKVSGAGTSEITIEGRPSLAHGLNDFEVIPDRIEAATYLMAGVITNSHILVKNVMPTHLEAILEVLKKMGANLVVDAKNRSIEVLPHEELKAVNVSTQPYPGFPTDAQAQLMALMTISKGMGKISENIFENRFMHVPELNRLGASIYLKGHVALVEGESSLTGAPVMCTDLRASAALIIAALCAKGATEIRRIYHLERGYDQLEKKLLKLGVSVQRLSNGG
jgi:UDP-N-acetylglucosamine 1-carboxyvinyltransferase